MDGLAKGIDGFNAFVFGKRLKVVLHLFNQSLLHKIPHSLRYDFIRSL